MPAPTITIGSHFASWLVWLLGCVVTCCILLNANWEGVTVQEADVEVEAGWLFDSCSEMSGA